MPEVCWWKCQDFLKYIHWQSGLTGKDLYHEIISSVESFNVDIQNCRGQGYDGTGAVAGKVNGLAALFLKEARTISIYWFYLLRNHVDTSTKSK